MYPNHVFLCIALLILIGSPTAYSSPTSDTWKEETDIYQPVYDAPLCTSRQPSTIDLSARMHLKPSILALIFTRCTGVCNPLILELQENLKRNPAQRDHQVIVVSFDPRDTSEDMYRYAQRFDLADDPLWTFATTDSIIPLLSSLSFDPSWDPQRQQYDHDALLVGLNTEGIITKKLIGLRSAQDLSSLISSIHNIYAPTYRMPNPNMLFSCFNYDSKTGKNTPGLGLLFIALPALLTVAILLGLHYYTRSSRH